jgi:hypothetical protein
MIWMTPNVVGMLTKIEKDSAWDVLPILADALEEGGYTDGPALLAMRSGDSLLAKPWLIRLVEGKAKFTEVKNAVNWMTEHAKKFGDSEYAEDDVDFERPILGAGKTFEWLLADVCRATSLLERGRACDHA